MVHQQWFHTTFDMYLKLICGIFMFPSLLCYAVVDQMQKEITRCLKKKFKNLFLQ